VLQRRGCHANLRPFQVFLLAALLSYMGLLLQVGAPSSHTRASQVITSRLQYTVRVAKAVTSKSEPRLSTIRQHPFPAYALKSLCQQFDEYLFRMYGLIHRKYSQLRRSDKIATENLYLIHASCYLNNLLRTATRYHGVCESLADRRADSAAKGMLFQYENNLKQPSDRTEVAKLDPIAFLR
jgi:hypothetical protein